MNVKKLLLIILPIAVVAIIVIIIVLQMAKNNATPPPAQNNDENNAQVLGEWQFYNASAFGYAFQTPTSWYMDNKENGYHIYLSNNPELDSLAPGNTTLEITGTMVKPANTDLAAYLKTNAGKGGNVGKITESKTITGARVVSVEHSGGLTTNGPGYAIEKSKTEFVYVVVAGDKSDSKIPEIISSFVIL